MYWVDLEGFVGLLSALLRTFPRPGTSAGSLISPISGSGNGIKKAFY